jgi:hypothetical protein
MLQPTPRRLLRARSKPTLLLHTTLDQGVNEAAGEQKTTIFRAIMTKSVCRAFSDGFVLFDEV